MFECSKKTEQVRCVYVCMQAECMYVCLSVCTWIHIDMYQVRLLCVCACAYTWIHTRTHACVHPPQFLFLSFSVFVIILYTSPYLSQTCATGPRFGPVKSFHSPVCGLKILPLKTRREIKRGEKKGWQLGGGGKARRIRAKGLCAREFLLDLNKKSCTCTRAHACVYTYMHPPR